MAVVETAERRPGLLARYSARLARDYPLIWATRMDIPILFFLVATPAFLLFMMMWTPRFTYTDPRVSGALETKAIVAYSCFGGIAALVAIFWMLRMMSSLQLATAPRLHWLPWSTVTHLATLLLLLPAAFGFLYGASDYLSTGSTFFGAGLTLLLAGYSAASFLAVFAALARLFGVQEVLIGTLIMIAQIAGWGLLISVTDIGDRKGEAVVTILVFLLCCYYLAVLWNGARMRSSQRLTLLYLPVSCVTAGPMFMLAALTSSFLTKPITADPHLHDSGGTTGVGGLGLGLAGYVGAIVLTQLLIGRVDPAARRKKK